VEIPKKYTAAETSVLLCYDKLTPRLLVKLDYLVFACHARPMNTFAYAASVCEHGGGTGWAAEVDAKLRGDWSEEASSTRFSLSSG